MTIPQVMSPNKSTKTQGYKPLKPRRAGVPLSRTYNGITAAQLKEIAGDHARTLARAQNGSLLSQCAKAGGTLLLKGVDLGGKVIGSVTKAVATTTVAFGLVAGALDHLDMPNPENEATGTRIVRFGAQNIVDTVRDVMPDSFVESVRQGVQDIRPNP